MAGALVKLSGKTLMANIREKSQLMFSKYLLLTNTAIAMGFSGTGDLMQQRYEKLLKKRSGWDALRTANIASSGLFVGPLCHFWYQFLDRVLPGTAVRIVLKKVLADQIIASPLCVFSFLICVGYAEGASSQEIKQEFLDKGPALLKAEMLVWPPLQLINFFLLPTRFRVLYDNVVSLAFDNFYSYIKYGEQVHSREISAIDFEDPDDLLAKHLEETCISSRISHV